MVHICEIQNWFRLKIEYQGFMIRIKESGSEFYFSFVFFCDTIYRKYSAHMRILKEATTMKRKSNVQRERFQSLDNEMDPRAFI